MFKALKTFVAQMLGRLLLILFMPVFAVAIVALVVASPLLDIPVWLLTGRAPVSTIMDRFFQGMPGGVR